MRQRLGFQSHHLAGTRWSQEDDSTKEPRQIARLCLGQALLDRDGPGRSFYATRRIVQHLALLALPLRRLKHSCLFQDSLFFLSVFFFVFSLSSPL